MLELVISLAASSVLAAGLVSALYISAQALSTGGTAAQDSVSAQTILQDLACELQMATAITERTATSIAFIVPDQDGDFANETIRYAWSGIVGDPLTYTYNGTTTNLAEDVQSFDLSALTRTMLADSLASTTPVGVVFEEFTEAFLSSNGTGISIATPPSYAEGDLLIAAVATDGDSDASLAAPAGWNVIQLGGHSASSTSKVTFGVWWKLAGSSEPSSHSFSWAPSEQAYGWIMRFTGHDAASPIHVSTLDRGSGILNIPSPAVTTTVDDCLILRLAGIDNKKITVDSTGLSGHTSITMDHSSTSVSAVSGGAAYVTQETAGDSGSSNFVITGIEEYVSVTLAIAPETS